MYVLGINDSHNATACLLLNGKIISCVSEERFTRIKNQGGIPISSVAYCLSQANILTKDLAAVVMSGLTFPSLAVQTSKTAKKRVLEAPSLTTRVYKFGRHQMYALRQRLEYDFPSLSLVTNPIYDLAVLLYSPYFRQERRNKIQELLHIPKERIHFADHHLCHAYAALYSSQFPTDKKKALVFTSDAQGDKLCATVSVFNDGKVTVVAKTPLYNSLGALYSNITMYLGMKLLEDEYKVMGLVHIRIRKKQRKYMRFYEALFGLISHRCNFGQG